MSRTFLKRVAIPAVPCGPSSFVATRSLASVTSTTSLDDRTTGASAAAAFLTSPKEHGLNPSLSMHDLLPAVQFSAADYQRAVQHLCDKGYGHRSLIWDQRVVWGDHDQFGHVNHVRYIEWFESARALYFTKIFGPESLRPGGSNLSLILANLNIRYRRPLRGDDTVLIAQDAVFPIERSDRFILRGTAYSLHHQDVVATADQTTVIFDYEKNKPVPIPATQLDLMKEYAVQRAS